MILEFLLPIVGWLILFFVCFIVYTNVFYKGVPHQTPVEGQTLYAVIAAFFWIVVYICLSSIWSILYSLIDIKYPDILGAASNYGYPAVGAAYDTFAFPLAMTLVSSITALILAFWLVYKFQQNKNLRPQRLYSFMRNLVYLGSVILAFSGFVYVVYSWLYGNLPIAILYKGIVAFLIVGSVALYFYLVADGENKKEANISRAFALLLVLVTGLTLAASFKIIGTPEQARLYRLDSLTLQDLQTVKYEIDNQGQSFNLRINNLSEITSSYVKTAIKRTDMSYAKTDKDYTLCAEFNSDMPATVNTPERDMDWDYTKGTSCFTFPQLPTYSNAGNNPPKPVY
jgi:hypothetical protein